MTEKQAAANMEILRMMSEFRYGGELMELYQDIQAILNHGGETKITDLDWDYIMAEADKRWFADHDAMLEMIFR
jgi:hypothetical protein